MSTMVQVWLNEELRKLNNQFQFSMMCLKQCKTMREVIGSQLHVPSQLRGVPDAKSKVNQYNVEATKVLERLLDAQLEKLDGLPGDQRQAEIARLRVHEWNCLRGHYPLILHKAERGLHRFK